jgi:NitT/TauT family transport system substrate-binding protein
MRRSKIGVTVSLAAALGLSVAGCSSSGGSTTTAAAGNSAPVTVTIAVSNVTNQTYLSVDLALALGYFTKQGVNVKLVSTTSGNLSWTDLLSGHAEGVLGFYDHVQVLQAQGISAESVITLNQAPGMVELVSTADESTITSPADVAGKKVGITGLGGSTQYIADYLAVHNGVPVSQLHPINVATGSTFVSAMEKGSIDIGVTTDPTVSTILAQHAGKILVDLRSLSGTQAALGNPYPGSSLSFETSWANNNKSTVQKMVNALVEALHYIQTHSAAQITDVVPAADYGATGKTAYEEALANSIGIYSPTGLMTTDGPQGVEHVLEAYDPGIATANLNLSKTYTDTFVQAASTSTAAN